MAKQISVNIQWHPAFGKRPMGSIERPSQYGNFNGKTTYLDRCPCGNPRCKALISRYTESNNVCIEQTLALYEESVNLLTEYINKFSTLVQSGRWNMPMIMWCDTARQILEYSGRISFYQDPVTRLWKYHFADCRLIVALSKMYLQAMRPQLPLLTSGKEEDDNDPARKIEDDIPANYEKGDWWKNLFNTGNDEENSD